MHARAHLLPVTHATLPFPSQEKASYFQSVINLLSIRNTITSLQINEIIYSVEEICQGLNIISNHSTNSVKSRLIDMVTPTQEEATF